MLKKIGFIVASVFLLAGCGHFANLGIDSERLDTINKQFVAYAGEITALAMLGEELVARNVITSAQGLKAAGYLQEALDLVEVAHAEAILSGDPLAAETTLEKVQRSVTLALGILTAFTPTSSTAFIDPRNHESFERWRLTLLPV